MDHNNEKPSLLILADDLTGALDSGVQLTQKGKKVVIMTEHESVENVPEGTDVVVINTETRHLSGKEAYRIVSDLVVKGMNRGITHIYKKTDSGCRGNVGAELTAVLDASGADHINFIPAYPNADRITMNGIQYVNGKPLSKSVFADDPIDPVTESRIDDLIHLQSEVPVVSSNDGGRHGIIVYDAVTASDMKKIAASLEENKDLRLTAGSAGFLEVYPMGAADSGKAEIPMMSDKLIVLSGSVNEVTRTQLDYTEKKGALRFHVPLDRVLNSSWDMKDLQNYTEHILMNNNALILVDTLGTCGCDSKIGSEAKAERIALYMGRLARVITEKAENRTLMIIGGDTLRGFITELNISMVEPIAEISPGIVLAKYRHDSISRYLITKSGGFGKEDQLNSIMNWLKNNRKEI